MVTPRYKKLKYPGDFNRPPRDCVNARGFWTMEEYLCFVETWSVILFQLVVVPARRGCAKSEKHVLHDERLRAMWQHIRAVVLLMCRPHSGAVEATACAVSSPHSLTLVHLPYQQQCGRIFATLSTLQVTDVHVCSLPA